MIEAVSYRFYNIYLDGFISGLLIWMRNCYSSVLPLSLPTRRKFFGLALITNCVLLLQISSCLIQFSSSRQLLTTRNPYVIVFTVPHPCNTGKPGHVHPVSHPPPVSLTHMRTCTEFISTFCAVCALHLAALRKVSNTKQCYSF